MPAPPSAKRVSVSDIKSKLLNPALTSQFQCWFNPPEMVINWVKQRAEAGLGNVYNPEFISLSCCEASLPGSSLATHENNSDYTGVTQRFAYRRLYDDRADFTFYVDHDYSIIYFFENWLSFIANEQNATGVDGGNFNYRMNYPDDYITSAIYINKFEKDYAGKSLNYRFINAYPISIISMPVSYDSSSLLKCTVSFTYIRYVLGSDTITQEKINNQTGSADPQFGTDWGTDPNIPTPKGYVSGPVGNNFGTSDIQTPTTFVNPANNFPNFNLGARA